MSRAAPQARMTNIAKEQLQNRDGSTEEEESEHEDAVEESEHEDAVDVLEHEVADAVIAAPKSLLEQFLMMDNADRLCDITFNAASITIMSDFKNAYKAAMKHKRVSAVAGPEFTNAAIFKRHGFNLSTKMEQICLSCKQLANWGCCPQYKNSNRGRKHYLNGMMLVVLPDLSV